MKRQIAILGQKGRTTIPWQIRTRLGLEPGDIISYEMQGESLILRRERLCTKCNQPGKSLAEVAVPLFDAMEELSPNEQRALLVYLYDKWARRNN